MSNKKYDWIDTLKYIACLGVFCSHYCSAFVEIDKNLYASQYLPKEFLAFTDVFSMFLNGAFWVRFFCIISGFLVAFKVIESFEDLVKAIIGRYIRFIIPMGTYLLCIVAIGLLFGYHAIECGKMIGATWLADNDPRPLLLIDGLKMIFLFDITIDGPLWTVMPIFIGSCIVYIIRFILYKTNLPTRYWGCMYFICFLASIVKYTINTLCISCCLLGAALYWFKDHIKIEKKVGLFIIFADILFVTVLHNYVYDILVKLGIDVPVRFGLDGYGYIVYAGVLFMSVCCTSIVSNAMSKINNPRITKSSFSVYVLHMPLMTSLSALMMMSIMNTGIRYAFSCIGVFVISSICLVLLTTLYSNIIEVFINRSIKIVNSAVFYVLDVIKMKTLSIIG